MRAADLAERCADCVASARALISATLSGLILDDCTADVDFNHAERDAGVRGASDMLRMLLVVGWGVCGGVIHQDLVAGRGSQKFSPVPFSISMALPLLSRCSAHNIETQTIDHHLTNRLSLRGHLPYWKSETIELCTNLDHDLDLEHAKVTIMAGTVTNRFTVEVRGHARRRTITKTARRGTGGPRARRNIPLTIG